MFKGSVGASGASGSHSLDPLAGGTWRSKLVYFERDANGRVTSQKECSHHSLLSFRSKLPTRANVKKMTYCKIDLDEVKKVVKALTHHFIEMETEDGHVFTFEKDKVCVLVQSCPTTKLPLALREYRGKDKRKKLKTLKLTKSMECEFPISRVIQWIFKGKLLLEDYGVTNANCQHFARGLWDANEFSRAEVGV